MFFWWVVPLLLVFVLMDRKAEGSSLWGANTSTWILLLLGFLLLGGFGMGFGMMGGGMMGYGHMGGYRNFGGFGGFGWLGVIIHLVLVAALVWGAVALFRRNGRSGSSGSSVTTEPEEIKVLKLRLAKGEITPEEYDVLRQKLQG